jgi:hypothetical protein
MRIDPTAAQGVAVTAAAPVPPALPETTRGPLARLDEAAPAVSPTIRLDPPTGVVVTRWYEGTEVANQIPTPRQLDAYRFGQGANGTLRGTADPEPPVSG